MKIFLVLAFVVLLGAIWVNRQRVYVRDPLAKVYKSDSGGNGDRREIKQTAVQVFINYSDDVLLEQDAQPGAYRILVQGWNRMPGTPVVLRCIRWMACLADADHASTYSIQGNGKGKYDPRVSMTGREVSFVDGDGATMRVTLR